jgi:hypothetical protein
LRSPRESHCIQRQDPSPSHRPILPRQSCHVPIDQDALFELFIYTRDSTEQCLTTDQPRLERQTPTTSHENIIGQGGLSSLGSPVRKTGKRKRLRRISDDREHCRKRMKSSVDTRACTTAVAALETGASKDCEGRTGAPELLLPSSFTPSEVDNLLAEAGALYVPRSPRT